MLLSVGNQQNLPAESVDDHIDKLVVETELYINSIAGKHLKQPVCVVNQCFAGKLWMGGGIAILALSMLGNFWILMGILFLMVAVPTCYSWNYARNRTQNKK